jgi:hypothetical protein
MAVNNRLQTWQNICNDRAFMTTFGKLISRASISNILCSLIKRIENTLIFIHFSRLLLNIVTLASDDCANGMRTSGRHRMHWFAVMSVPLIVPLNIASGLI